MPLQATSGAASYDGFGGGVVAEPNYIESCFSTYLYTGNSTARSITNNIDLSTKGGMVWFKARNVGSNHYQVDTARGNTKYLASNSTTSQMTFTDALTAFTTTGFNLGVDAAAGDINGTGYNMASWTFRKQPKFFDIVTYTGNGVAGTQIPHSLGSTPGCIMVKRYAGAGGAVDWAVWHNQLGGSEYLKLNTTDAGITNAAYPPFGAVTSTYFTVGNASATGNNGITNSNGDSFVAYVFAHNAGGFGLTGTDNVISCGSFTTNGSGNAAVSLGYEPQWVLIKQTDGVDSWYLNDNMRGMAVSGNQPNLSPNLSAAESAGGYNTYPNATGFTASVGIASKNYIYIAIRRGPMKVPTSGTSVFSPNTTTTNNTITTNFPVDLNIFRANKGAVNSNQFYDRLRGAYQQLISTATNAEATNSASTLFDNNTGSPLTGFTAGLSGVDWAFRRAPSFFDEVCYTYTSGSFVANHNLGVTPEMVILKRRDSTGNWFVYHQALGFSQRLNLNTTDSVIAASAITAATSTTFTTAFPGVGGATVVAYLFASCTGVSKVGSYAGNGSSQTINCGFTGGVRFLMIKNTTLGGTDWQVWDTARGITAGNDPVLYLNSTSPEVNADFITNNSVGFTLNDGDSQYNASGSTYIYLAIA